MSLSANPRVKEFWWRNINNAALFRPPRNAPLVVFFINVCLSYFHLRRRCTPVGARGQRWIFKPLFCSPPLCLDGAHVYSSDNKIAAAPRNHRKPKHGCGTKVNKKIMCPLAKYFWRRRAPTHTFWPLVQNLCSNQSCGKCWKLRTGVLKN